MHVRVPVTATVGSVVVAETGMGSLSQLVRANTCLGTMIRASESTHPMQQIFLQEMPGCGTTHSCNPGSMPPMLQDTQMRTRLEVLYRQEAWVAVDEMNFYLSMLQATTATTFSKVFVLPESVLDEEIEPMLQGWMCKVAPHDATPGIIVTALLMAHHWFPVALHLLEGGIKVITTPGGHDWLLLATRGLGDHISIVTVDCDTAFNNDCGFQAIGWLTQAIFDSEFGQTTRRSSPLSVSDCIAWRTLFEHHLFSAGTHSQKGIPACNLAGGAGHADLHTALSDLLRA